MGQRVESLAMGGERMTLHFATGHVDDAALLVKRWHYSRRPPANVQIVGTWHENGGLFGDLGECVAACFFSIPPTRWSETVLELSRLVRKDGLACSLTGLISMTCRQIARAKAGDLLVSFADNTQGHHGGIYQAASWNYHGKRERRMDGVLINGVFNPGRTLNSTIGTRSPRKLREILHGQTIEPHYDEGKYLYWKALNRNGEAKAKRLKLEKNKYEKPNANAQAINT